MVADGPLVSPRAGPALPARVRRRPVTSCTCRVRLGVSHAHGTQLYECEQCETRRATPKV